MPNQKNTANLEQLKTKINEAKSAAVVNYQGVTVNEMTDLRQKLRAGGGEFLVTKNTLIDLAFDKNPTISPDLEGMNALVLSFEDEVSALKIAFEFKKETDKLEIKSGWVDGKAIDAAEVEQLSKTPGKQELIGMLINRIQAPASGLVNVLQASSRDLVYALQAIADQKANA